MMYMLNSYKKIIENMIEQHTSFLNFTDIFLVTGVNLDSQTFSIKRMNVDESFDDVEIVGLGLGNGRCQMRLPSVNDIVLVTFIANSKTPIILGTLYDNVSNEKDQKIQLKDGEYYVNSQVNGSFLFFKQDNEIILRTPNGGKIKLKEDGSFKLFDKNNYGIESNGSGGITIRGSSINHTTNPGTW